MKLDAEDLSTIARLKAAGVPCWSCSSPGGRFASPTSCPDGTPSCRQAWLPGSEGAGVADVLFGDFDPTGKLPFS